MNLDVNHEEMSTHSQGQESPIYWYNPLPSLMANAVTILKRTENRLRIIYLPSHDNNILDFEYLRLKENRLCAAE